MTAVLRPVGGVGLIPLMAGVAVAETIIVDLGVEARLKWPNDVLVGGRKVGGILAETAWSQGEARHTLLGIGVNLNNQLPPDLPEATTLLAELGEEVDIEQFLYDLLERLGQRFRLLERKPSRILDAWRALSSTLGRRVEVVVDSGEKIQGVAVDIDQDGVLLLDTGCGRRGIVSGSLKERYR